MTIEEIINAGWEYANISIDETTEIPKNIEQIKVSARLDFIGGAKFVNKHWQKKTRWKSLETEPPTEYGYDTMYLLRTESGSPYLIPSLNKGSIKELISYGFTEWKEIE